ncbi:hypothetical protein [Streptomyces sp. NPDC046759]|uniref:hypothetical protein n=1 Tax=Streptomyces sp. NPDC046759 TaxID=3155019 RepID=UPI003404EEF7
MSYVPLPDPRPPTRPIHLPDRLPVAAEEDEAEGTAVGPLQAGDRRRAGGGPDRSAEQRHTVERIYDRLLDEHTEAEEAARQGLHDLDQSAAVLVRDRFDRDRFDVVFDAALTRALNGLDTARSMTSPPPTVPRIDGLNMSGLRRSAVRRWGVGLGPPALGGQRTSPMTNPRLWVPPRLGARTMSRAGSGSA